MTADAAEALLRIRFEPRDLDRMHELVVRNREERLTAAEATEMDSYRRVSFFLDLMHPKARLALKRREAARGPS